VVGIGASVQDACNRLGFKIRAFNAGSTKAVRQLDRYGNVKQDGKHAIEGTPLFDNIRSQGFYDLAEAMHTGQVKLLDTLPHADKLRRELGAHHYEPRERQIIVEKKDKIKAAIGTHRTSRTACWRHGGAGRTGRRASSAFVVRETWGHGRS
jgi:hypothetical protein